MRRLITTAVTCTALMTGSAGQTQDLTEALKVTIENIVLGGLPGGEMVQVMQALPETTKGGLIVWLNAKSVDAVMKGDTDAFDKYTSFLICMATKDCAEAQRLTAEGGTPKPAQAPAPAPAPVITEPFEIASVSHPSIVVSGGPKHDLKVQYQGQPTFPVTLTYRPKEDGCPRDVSCSTVTRSFSSPDNPLVATGALWCVNASKDILFDYEVLLTDASGQQTQPRSAPIFCDANK